MTNDLKFSFLFKLLLSVDNENMNESNINSSDNIKDLHKNYI